MAPRVFVRLTLVIAAAHLLVSMGALLLGFSLGSERFDRGRATPSLIEAAATTIADVLSQPMAAIWAQSYTGRSASSAIQWLAVLLNSFAWGIVLATVFAVMRRAWRS